VSQNRTFFIKKIEKLKIYKNRRISILRRQGKKTSKTLNDERNGESSDEK
jgi:hypothetical protein